MKYTNYYDLKLNLHKQMVNDIRKLMEWCDIKVINFDNYPSDVIGVPEIITSDLVILTVQKIILEEDDIIVSGIDENWNEPHKGISLIYNVNLTDIDCLYDSVFSVVNYIRNKKKKKS